MSSTITKSCVQKYVVKSHSNIVPDHLVTSKCGPHGLHLVNHLWTNSVPNSSGGASTELALYLTSGRRALLMSLITSLVMLALALPISSTAAFTALTTTYGSLWTFVSCLSVALLCEALLRFNNFQQLSTAIFQKKLLPDILQNVTWILNFAIQWFNVNHTLCGIETNQ